ncbi:TonB-dependent receptor [Chitinophaga sp. Cy-1792]|uniref:TonB-dependent receptor n=1 Tax=Chitinophaga sp. Cy-1792 TaxID=2608339 RepID=UPI00142073BB|nr:TonB-dependent receptor [Chitinophaga sp. Cy-1792]NIG55364.1 TonB-dependent receptor plug domain-containing protein [Chitinophaga sp. Cy-1792]
MNKIRQSRSILPQKKWWQVLTIFLLLASFRVMAQQPSLSRPISVSLNNTSLAAVIAEIDRQSEFSFSYDKNSLAAIKVATIHKTGVPLQQLLEELNATYGLAYQVNANTIAVRLSGPKGNPNHGSIRGRVVDFETATPLPGATIHLEGTGLGTITDNKGYYQLDNIPVSSYNVVITFIGYQYGKIDGVKIEKDRTAVYDVKMQTGGALKEVVVGSGIRKVKSVTHSTEQQLLQEIRGSTGVVSGISNELIAKTADRNAAEIVKRIAGVSVVDDRFIVVRGMNERYNLTYLNGNIAPSTELMSKAFAYDLLPSSVIDKILVYKSPVADLVGDYAGAAIKVFTKNAVPVKHFDMGLQLAYREGTSMRNVNSYNGGKLDFIGIDDGTRKLPGFSPGIFQSNKQVTGLSQEAMLKGFNSTLSPGTRYSTPDMQFFANYYNSWKIGQARLYDLTSVTYTKETMASGVYRQRGNTNMNRLASGDYGQSYGDKNRIINSQQTIETGKINVLENLQLKLNNNNSVSLQNFFVNDGKRFTGIDYTTPNTIPEYYRLETFKLDKILSFQQRMLYSANLSGRHLTDTSGKHELVWNIGYSYDLQSVPDQRISHFSAPFSTIDSAAWKALGSNGNASNTQAGMISRLFIKNIENVYNVSLDYTFHITPAFYLKTGGYELFKTREVGRRTFRVNRAGLRNDETVPPYGDLDWTTNYGYSNMDLIRFRPQELSGLWSTKYFPQDMTGLALYDVTTPMDAYTASEQYNAFYLMGDWKAAHEKLTLNAGLRWEYDRQRLSGAKVGAEGPGSIEEVNVDHKKAILLPSLNFSYRPQEKVVLRTSYGRTVNRPDFREITPYQDFDFQNNEVTVGTSHIVTAVIDNYDVRAEIYPRNGNEVFNLGAFYKHIQHPIERLRTELTSSEAGDVYDFTTITYDNSVSANLYGLEAEIKKSLSFIPGNVFRHLSLVINGSWIASDTRRRKVNNNYASDTAWKRGGQLQGQSPYILNTGIFYENAATGTKLGLVYNVSGPRIYAKSIRTATDTLQVNTFDRPDLLQLPMHLLDISLTQRIVRSLTLKLSIQNLLNQDYRIVEDHNFNQRYDKEQPVTDANGRTYYVGDNIYTKFSPGRYVLLQFTYAF